MSSDERSSSSSPSDSNNAPMSEPTKTAVEGLEDVDMKQQEEVNPATVVVDDVAIVEDNFLVQEEAAAAIVPEEVEPSTTLNVKKQRKRKRLHKKKKKKKQQPPNCCWTATANSSSNNRRDYGTWRDPSPARALRPLEKLRRLMMQRPQTASKFLRPEFRNYVERSFRPLGATRPYGGRHSNGGNSARASVASSCASSTTATTTSTIGRSKRSNSSLAIERHRQHLCHQLRRRRHQSPTTTTATALLALAMTMRIQRRALHSAWIPLPRLPAFRCPKCALSSRRLQLLQRHVCSRKRPPEYKNVDLTVELGFRSRVKDAMAVLEQIPRPQAARVRCPENVWHAWKSVPMERQPKTLCDIAWGCVARLHGLDQNVLLIQTNPTAAAATSQKAAKMDIHDTDGTTRPKNDRRSTLTNDAVPDHDYGQNWMGNKQKGEEGAEMANHWDTTRIKFYNVTEPEMALTPEIAGDKPAADEFCAAPPVFSSCQVPTWSGGRKRISSSILLKRREIIRKSAAVPNASTAVQDGGGQQKHTQFVTSPNGIAYFCRRCSRLFGRYMDWDDHLHDESDDGDDGHDHAAAIDGRCTAPGGEEPMEMQVLLNEQFPIGGRRIRLPVYRYYGLRRAQFSSARAQRCCTKCGTSGFLSRAEFHAHLLKCAMLPEGVPPPPPTPPALQKQEEQTTATTTMPPILTIKTTTSPNDDEAEDRTTQTNQTAHYSNDNIIIENNYGEDEHGGESSSSLPPPVQAGQERNNCRRTTPNSSNSNGGGSGSGGHDNTYDSMPMMVQVGGK